MAAALGEAVAVALGGAAAVALHSSTVALGQQYIA